MNKKEIFKTLAKSSREEVICLGQLVSDAHKVDIVKKPAKTLVMLKMRESTAGAVFYLGELLACEAMVKIGEKSGFAATIGDDYEKVFAMALIDAAMNANLPESVTILEKLTAMKNAVLELERKEFARILKSKVDFSVMEDIK